MAVKVRENRSSTCEAPALRNNILAYTLTFFTAVLFYNTFWGGIVTVLSSIEKRYSFASWQTGVILGAPEYGRILIVIPLTYLGGRGHIPRILGTCLLFLACAILLVSSPHFILTPTPAANRSNATTLIHRSSYSYICLPNRSDQFPSEHERITSDAAQHLNYIRNTALAIFLLGMISLGFAASPFTNIGFIYIDMNTPAKNAPFYIGLANSAITFGYMLGAFVAAWAMTIYVDLSEPPITPAHPDWIGAWWIPMVCSSIGVFVVGPVLFCFPKRMSRDEFDRGTPVDEKDNEMALMAEVDSRGKGSDKKTATLKGPKDIVMDFVRTTRRIVSNPLFICLTLTRISMDFGIWGYNAFLAKYIEVQFSAEAWTANIISGVALLFLGLANIGSGVAITFFKMTYRQTAQAMMALMVVGMTFAIILMFVGCHNINLSQGDVAGTCAAHCDCPAEDISAVCDVTKGVTYLSGCHAGCTEVVTNDSEASASVYAACNCTSSGQVTPGLCSSCDTMVEFAVLVLLLLTTRGVLFAPLLCLTIRSVDEIDRGLAIGINVLVAALTAWLPSGVVFGSIIDESCDVWQILDGSRGHCHIYDLSRYRRNIHGFTAGLILLELVSMAASYVLIRRRRFEWNTKSDLVVTV